jgi:hypothetical protein
LKKFRSSKGKSFKVECAARNIFGEVQ